MSLDWDYKGQMVDLSMPGYTIKALTNYQHDIPTRPKHHPYKSTPIKYGDKVQHIVEPDTSAPLTKDEIKHFQDIIGTLLYCGQAVNPTIVTALSAISSFQAKGIEAVLNVFHQLLDCVAARTSATIRYHASDMILALDTEASYLSEHGDQIRAAAYMFLAK